MRKRQQYFGMSQIGKYHIEKNMVNQDACAFEKTKTGYVVAVADGLGSKKHSDIGSKMACKAVIKSVKQHNFENPLDELLQKIHSNWIDYIKNNEISECSSTCLFAIKYQQEVIVGQLGDGAVVVVAKDKDKSFALVENKENSFSNITHCLSVNYHKEQWKIQKINAENILVIVLFTDGISEDIAKDSQIDFAKEFYLSHKYFRPKQKERKVKQMLSEWNNWGSQDDKTIAYLSCERLKK